MAKLFVENKNAFRWKDNKPFHIRNKYNELLNIVVNEYFSKQYPITTSPPNFLNKNYCLTLSNFSERCGCGGTTPVTLSTISKGKVNIFTLEDKNLGNAQTELGIAERDLDFQWKKFDLGNTKSAKELVETNKLKDAIDQKADVKTVFTAVIGSAVIKANTTLETALRGLENVINTFETQNAKFKGLVAKKKYAEYEAQLKLDEQRIQYEKLLAEYEIAQRDFDYDPSKPHMDAQADKKGKFESFKNMYAYAAVPVPTTTPDGCNDIDKTTFCLPLFAYERLRALTQVPVDSPLQLSDLNFNTSGLTVGAVIWLYYYERMGIFKILGVLMDDYNYKGKYTISGSRADKNGNPNSYSVLMDTICSLYRMGIGSNIRDRITLYQRTLGVTIDNNLGIESERNTGFMQTFNKLIEYMLEYYKTKQLAQAIQAQTLGATQPRSSVATQTSIRDTMNLLKQQFEPIEYGRNQINTFLGIATVHATLCLVNMLRKEIGIPDQYESPEEFIPAAYDILVAKRPVTLNEINRFIVHDNCASYGYRLLTDIETADLREFSVIATGSTLDTWLNDIEGVVEGYNNAYKSVLEPASAMAF